MADEINKLIDGENENPAETRIKELSNKVKLTAQERDEKDRLLNEANSAKNSAEKKLGFYKDFNKISAKYKNAPEHLDEIESKFMAGYDMEDAAVSVLAKAGKLTTPSVSEEREMPSGGSSDTPIRSQGSKSFSEMSQSERRAELDRREQEGGDLTKILERKSLM